jgi:hypothetical protein
LEEKSAGLGPVGAFCSLSMGNTQVAKDLHTMIELSKEGQRTILVLSPSKDLSVLGRLPHFWSVVWVFVVVRREAVDKFKTPRRGRALSRPE